MLRLSTKPPAPPVVQYHPTDISGAVLTPRYIYNVRTVMISALPSCWQTASPALKVKTRQCAFRSSVFRDNFHFRRRAFLIIVLISGIAKTLRQGIPEISTRQTGGEFLPRPSRPPCACFTSPSLPPQLPPQDAPFPQKLLLPSRGRQRVRQLTSRRTPPAPW